MEPLGQMCGAKTRKYRKTVGLEKGAHRMAKMENEKKQKRKAYSTLKLAVPPAAV